MDRIDSDLTLEQMAIGTPCVVNEVCAPGHAPEWKQWLEELGFIAGELATIMAKGRPGGDPLMVRVGTSTFALRCAEAACVHVALPPPEGAQ